jgi:hypothetical protein
MNTPRLIVSLSSRFPRLPLPSVPLGALVLVSVLGASAPGCNASQCEAFKGAVNASAAAINGVVGAIEAWENVGSAMGPTSCNDPGADPDLATASYSGGSIKVCDMSGKCGMTPVSALCDASAKDTSCNSCVKSKCCADVPAFTGEIVASCLVGCQSGLKDCGGTTLDAATSYCMGEPDDAYRNMGACVKDKCDDVCAAFTWN